MTPRAQSRIDVAICLDANLLLPAAVLLRSIAEHATAAAPVRVHALTTFDGERLQALAPGPAFPDFELLTIDVGDRFADLPRNSYISQGTYLRFLLPDLLDDTQHLVYLDVDMVVRRDLAPLRSLDLGDAYLAATHDVAMRLGSTRWDHFDLCYAARAWTFADYQHDVIALRDADAYFNAGLIVMNLPAWRRDALAARTLAALDRTPTFKFLDQDALNHVVQGRYLRLDARWNAMANCLDRRRDRRLKTIFSRDGRAWERQRRIWLCDPWIIHFAGPNKPWDAEHPIALGEVWWNYARRSAAWPHLQEAHAAFEAVVRAAPRHAQPPGKASRSLA